MDEFFKTRMGQRFYESTMPEIAEELARLNRNLESMLRALDNLTRERLPDKEDQQTGGQ